MVALLTNSEIFDRTRRRRPGLGERLVVPARRTAAAQPSRSCRAAPGWPAAGSWGIPRCRPELLRDHRVAGVAGMAVLQRRADEGQRAESRRLRPGPEGRG